VGCGRIADGNTAPNAFGGQPRSAPAIRSVAWPLCILLRQDPSLNPSMLSGGDGAAVEGSAGISVGAEGR
jgi:hypothetical protein